MDKTTLDHLQHRRQSFLRRLVLVLLRYQLIVRLSVPIRSVFRVVLVARGGYYSPPVCVAPELLLASQIHVTPLVRPTGPRDVSAVVPAISHTRFTRNTALQVRTIRVQKVKILPQKVAVF